MHGCNLCMYSYVQLHIKSLNLYTPLFTLLCTLMIMMMVDGIRAVGFDSLQQYLSVTILHHSKILQLQICILIYKESDLILDLTIVEGFSHNFCTHNCMHARTIQKLTTKLISVLKLMHIERNYECLSA